MLFAKFANADAARSRLVGLSLLFGTLAFLQGVADPAEGLFSQPTLSLLERRGRSLGSTTDFATIVALPWIIKPLFGAISDSLPLFGSRRKSYLIVSSFLMLLGFLTSYVGFANWGHPSALLSGLMLATAGVAFSDVVSDALMIETGQPRGLTGRFQSIQWSCAYAATILTGYLGGWISKHHREKAALLVLVAVSGVLLAVSTFAVEVRPWNESPRKSRTRIRRRLLAALRRPQLRAVGGFLFLWNFNPFTFRILRSYMIHSLALSEEFFGGLMSIFAIACLLASVTYGFYCRRVPMRWLVHASIVLGVLQTIAYWGLVGKNSAIAITIFAGLTYMTATLIQLDLAARVCPPRIAGTAFALIMAMENLATTASVWIGGRFYDWWGKSANFSSAYAASVTLGALTTAACWLLVPLLPNQYDQKGDGGN